MPMLLEQPVRPAPEAMNRTPSRLLRIVFSFPAMLVCLLALLSVFTVRTRLNDPDLWWHLKTGEMIWQTHSIPRVDSFSFTTNHHPYTPHEWLAQLTIYAAYHFGGYSGIMLWLCLISSLVSVAGYGLCWLYSGNGKIAFLGALGIWFFATVGLSARPQMLGYLFLIAELIVVSLGQRNQKWLLILPGLFALWVNCHGSFLFGLIVLGAVFFCGFFDFEVGLIACEPSGRRKQAMLALALFLSTGALFLNPVGLNQITYPLNTMLGQQQIGLQYSSEWQPPAMTDIRTPALFVAMALVLLVPILRRVSLPFPELLLVALGFVLAVQHQRMFFVFGILVMPLLSLLLSTAWDRYEPAQDSVVSNMIAIPGIVIAMVLGFPSPQNLNAQVQKGNPGKALEFVQRSGLSGRMLNEYVYGGYLIWAAPDHKVFIDGRADVFEWTGVLGDYMDWVNLQADPSFLLDKYRIDFCFLSRDEPIARVLPLIPGWKTIYSDATSVIFARSAGRNAPDNTAARQNKPVA
jgi:hypothetical protein